MSDNLQDLLKKSEKVKSDLNRLEAVLEEKQKTYDSKKTEIREIIGKDVKNVTQWRKNLQSELDVGMEDIGKVLSQLEKKLNEYED